ncbi:MAG: transposase [Bacilli bacterium]|nr:transposase [Bacilli bacterium]
MYKVDTYFLSSQICNVCGHQNKITKDLGVRNYKCPSCKRKLERDYNAAVNIIFKGIEQYMKELV